MTQTVIIIDYGSGNLRSAAKAFERAVHDSAMDMRVLVTSDPEHVVDADRIVLPGVGAYGDCRRGLHARTGLPDALETAVVQRGRPFLGICVGMQLMASVGREFGDHTGLGWIDGEVVELTPDDESLKIPHMGWNQLSIHDATHPVLRGLDDRAHAYFVHSFHLRAVDHRHVLAATDHGGPVAAIVGRDNMIGTQFHPEKSQTTGLCFITGFLAWKP